VEVLVNQVGYETTGPKRFVCRSEENLGPAGHFEAIDCSGRKLLEGQASRVGSAGGDGSVHYAGDFSELRSAGGDFQIRFEAGNRLAISRCFGVGSSILWRLTKPLVVDRLRASRAVRGGSASPGGLKPPGILADDGLFHDVSGGWFDDGAPEGGTSLDRGARTIIALGLAFERDPRDPQTRSELRWGADWLGRLMSRFPDSGAMIARAEPDGRLARIGPGECREPSLCLVAGFLYARLSEELGEIDLLRRGELFWDEYRSHLGGLESRDAVAAMLLSEIALHVALLEPRCLASAESRAESLLDEVAESFAAWSGPGLSLPALALAGFAESLPDHPLTPRAKEVVGRFMDARVDAASGAPFGLAPYEEDAIGRAPALLRAEEAWQAMAAHRVTGRSAYVALATNALNWILGLNDHDVCLLAGAGIRRDQTSRPGTREGAILASPGASPGDVDIATGAAYLTALSLL
jgi:hypothetical protein